MTPSICECRLAAQWTNACQRALPRTAPTRRPRRRPCSQSWRAVMQVHCSHARSCVMAASSTKGRQAICPTVLTAPQQPVYRQRHSTRSPVCWFAPSTAWHLWLGGSGHQAQCARSQASLPSFTSQFLSALESLLQVLQMLHLRQPRTQHTPAHQRPSPLQQQQLQQGTREKQRQQHCPAQRAETQV
jgi:hypothetical protein